MTEEVIIYLLKTDEYTKFELAEKSGHPVAYVQGLLNQLEVEKKITSGLYRTEGTGDYERRYVWVGD